MKRGSQKVFTFSWQALSRRYNTFIKEAKEHYVRDAFNMQAKYGAMTCASVGAVTTSVLAAREGESFPVCLMVVTASTAVSGAVGVFVGSTWPLPLYVVGTCVAAHLLVPKRKK